MMCKSARMRAGWARHRHTWTNWQPSRTRDYGSRPGMAPTPAQRWSGPSTSAERSEEHTSELQSHLNLVCRLLLEKKNHNLTASEAQEQVVSVRQTCHNG